MSKDVPKKDILEWLKFLEDEEIKESKSHLIKKSSIKLYQEDINHSSIEESYKESNDIALYDNNIYSLKALEEKQRKEKSCLRKEVSNKMNLNIKKVEKLHLTHTLKTARLLELEEYRDKLLIAHNSCLSHKKIRSISSGKCNIDSSIDLHGYTIESAFYMFEQFVTAAYLNGQRLLLVITGKGRAKRCDLIKNDTINGMIQEWVNIKSVKDKILYFSHAAQHHGGSGAFYIFLKRKRR